MVDTEGNALRTEIVALEGPDGMPDGAEILIGTDADFEEMMSPAMAEHGANLAEFMPEDDLRKLSSELCGLVEDDISARKDWVNMFVRGLEIIGFKYEERSDPWDGACGVYSTILAEAAIRFQAETMIETFPAAGPVKTKIIGQETPEKEKAAARVKADMNYRLTEEMVEYRHEHERMLFMLGLGGSAFKKTYHDPNMRRQVSIFVPAEEVVLPYGTSNVETAERVTHIMRKTPNELHGMQQSGFYRDVDIGEPAEYHSDIEEKQAELSGFELTQGDNRHTFYEIHTYLVLPGIDGNPVDGEPGTEPDTLEDVLLPYVVTIDRDSQKVLAIRRNWKESDVERNKRQHFVHYCYIPGMGSYGLGLIHLIGGYSEAGTSIIRQLVDAGTLSNLPGGLKSRELHQKGEDTPIGPGEWRDVDVPSGSIRDHLLPLPYKAPSQTLLALLDKITQDGRRLGAISDLNVSDMSANAPVGTTLALLERTLKPMTAVQARVHYSMKQEFKILKALIEENLPDVYEYIPMGGNPSVKASDYAVVEVIPVSDPNASTMAQRVVQYQAVLQMAQQAPQIYDLPQLHRQMIDVLGVKNADKLIPNSEEPKPRDPVSENMGVLTGKPLKAFIYQDHKAHIAAHMAFMQDPMIMQGIGQNPQAKQMMAALQAHLAEHIAFDYRRMVEDKLGAQLPPPDEALPPEVEVNLARLVADAGRQLTQEHRQKAAQMEAQKKAQDPVIQNQQQAEQTKRMEVERKARKDAVEAQLRKDEQMRKRLKDYIEAQLRAEEIANDRRETDVEAQRIMAELQNERVELDRRLELERMQALLDSMEPPGGPEQ